MEYEQKYLSKLHSDGKLTKKGLLDFYSLEEVKGKSKQIENDLIKALE